jgi:hypothetical protein
MKDADIQTPGDVPPNDDSDWQCSFCGDTIREHSVEVAITHSDGAAQRLRAHIDCLKAGA